MEYDFLNQDGLIFRVVVDLVIGILAGSLGAFTTFRFLIQKFPNIEAHEKDIRELENRIDRIIEKETPNEKVQKVSNVPNSHSDLELLFRDVLGDRLSTTVQHAQPESTIKSLTTENRTLPIDLSPGNDMQLRAVQLTTQEDNSKQELKLIEEVTLFTRKIYEIFEIVGRKLKPLLTRRFMSLILIALTLLFPIIYYLFNS